MAVLKSELFTKPSADDATAKKLQQCADADPSPVQSHFSVRDNPRGEHIRKVQEALVAIQKADPKLTLHTFSVNGVYDGDFAKAVKDYKTARDIRNFANAIDDVIGVLTIQRMDKDLQGSSPKPEPQPDVAIKADVVLRLEGNRVERRMSGHSVLPSNRFQQAYFRVPGSDKIFVKDDGRFLLLDGWFLHNTGGVAKNMVTQALASLKADADKLGATIERVYFYGSSAGGRSVLDFAELVKQTLGRLTMIGVADAHFTQADTPDTPKGEADALGAIASPTNTPDMPNFDRTNTEPPGQRFNWFQIAGNHGKKRNLGFGDAFFTSDFGGEIHGTVRGYRNAAPLQVSAAAERDDARAHDEACARGLDLMEDKIITSLMMP